MSKQGVTQIDTKKILRLSSNQQIVLLLILLFGFFLRMAMVDMVEQLVPIRADALEYYSYAINLKEAGIYSMTPPASIAGIAAATDPVADSNRPPGYALFLIPFVEAPPTMEMLHSVQFSQVLLSTLTILLGFLIFRDFLTAPVSLAGTFLVAISPHLVSLNINMLTESLFTFVLALFVIIMINALSRRTALLFGLGGLTLGILVLIKPSISLFLFFFAVLYLACHHRKNDVKLLAIFAAAYFVLQLPWMLYAASVDIAAAEKPKALVSLHNGSYPGLMYNDIPASRGIPHRADPNYNEIDTYGEFFADLGERISNEPGKYLHWYLLGKTLMMYSWDMVAGFGDIYVYPVEYSPYYDRQPFGITYLLMKALHNPLMLLSFVAMFLVFWNLRHVRIEDTKQASLAMLAAISLYFVALHILVTPLPRYMIPLRPLTYGLALYLPCEIVALCRDRFFSGSPRVTAED